MKGLPDLLTFLLPSGGVGLKSLSIPLSFVTVFCELLPVEGLAPFPVSYIVLTFREHGVCLGREKGIAFFKVHHVIDVGETTLPPFEAFL